jgi:hypothetical protein
MNIIKNVNGLAKAMSVYTKDASGELPVKFHFMDRFGNKPVSASLNNDLALCRVEYPSNPELNHIQITVFEDGPEPTDAEREASLNKTMQQFEIVQLRAQLKSANEALTAVLDATVIDSSGHMSITSKRCFKMVAAYLDSQNIKGASE